MLTHIAIIKGAAVAATVAVGAVMFGDAAGQAITENSTVTLKAAGAMFAVSFSIIAWTLRNNWQIRSDLKENKKLLKRLYIKKRILSWEINQIKNHLRIPPASPPRSLFLDPDSDAPEEEDSTT